MFLNKMQLIARLTHTPEISQTKNGVKKARLTLANNTKWKDKDGKQQEQTYYYEVIFWRKIAEVLENYAVKGQELYIEGKLTTDKYEGRDGVTKYRTYILGEVLQLGAKPANSDRPTAMEKKEQKQNEIVDDFGPLPDDENTINIEDIPF